MKRILKGLLSILVVVVMLAAAGGCSQQASPNGTLRGKSQSSLPQQSEVSSLSSSQADSKLPFVELKEAGVITVYKAYPNSEIFEPTKVAVDNADITLLDIIGEAEKALNVKLPILAVTQEAGTVTINLSQAFMDTYDKWEIYPILNTIGMTLKENQRNFNAVVYQVNGRTDFFGESYALPVLKLIQGSPEEFSALRAKVPYEGLDTITMISEYDEIGNKIANFLSMLPPLDKDIATISELDNQYVLRTALYYTQYYTTDIVNGEEEHYREVLKPIEGPISEKLGQGFAETMFWLKEHVEQTAKIIFGNSVTIEHESLKVYNYLYFAVEGVYTPPHTEGGPMARPFMLDYEDLGDRYRAKVVYVQESMEGYIDADTRAIIPEAELKNYVQTKGRKREIILRKAEGGTLQFVSHRFLP